MKKIYLLQVLLCIAIVSSCSSDKISETWLPEKTEGRIEIVKIPMQ